MTKLMRPFKLRLAAISFLSFYIALTIFSVDSIAADPNKNTTPNVYLRDHTKLGTLSSDEFDLLRRMNKEHQPDYFNNLAKYHSINEFDIFHIEGREGILVTSNSVVIAEITKTSVTIFKPIAEAPSAGTESVHLSGKYILYSGDNFSIEDYGLDGIDVKYVTADPTLSDSYLPSAECRQVVTLSAGLACCQRRTDRLFIGYSFSKTEGWKPVAESSKLHSRCTALNF
ncbi:MAG: hypothetical protein ACK4KV_15400 [Rhodocyclaceae bacterium]